MVDINTTIFRSPIGIGGPQLPVAPVDRLRPVTPQPAPPEGDSFVQGQYDRNRAVTSPPMEGTARQGQARQAYELQSRSGEAKRSGDQGAAPKGGSPGDKAGAAKESGTQGNRTLSAAEKSLVSQLAQIDVSVRSHENAHLAAAGGLAKGGASFTMAHGPDGRSYAVGGEVQIDTSPGATPAETIARMQAVRAAALAPADPSSQDLKVAAQAALVSAQAIQELSQMKLSEAGGKKGGVEAKPENVPGAQPSAETSTAAQPNANPAANSGGSGWYRKYAMNAAGFRPAGGSFDLIV